MNYDELSEIYDYQYENYREDLHFYAELAKKSDSKVLEIGAGTGRVTSFLQRRGIDIIGLEPSSKMIDRAFAREDGKNLNIIQGNMQDFQLNESFNLIIAPFNAMMHLYNQSEQLQALQNIRSHLKSGGSFVFDLYVPNFGKMNTLRHEGETFNKDGNRTDVFLVQRHDKEKQSIYTEYFIDTTDSQGNMKRKYRTLVQRYFNRYEMEWLLRYAGYQQPKVTGSFQGGPLGVHSEIMIFQAKAPV